MNKLFYGDNLNVLRIDENKEVLGIRKMIAE
jgi:hypothetical protein